MIAILKESASDEAVSHIVSWIEKKGLKTDVSRGENETIIGRATGSLIEDSIRCALSEPPEAVEIRHMALVRTEEGFFLQQMAPEIKAELNGEPVIGTVELADGDKISVGSSVLVFQRCAQ